jgi:hypothetical protein
LPRWFSLADDLRIGERLCLIKARRESMEPTSSDGEVLLVDTDESVRVPGSVKNGAVASFAGAVSATSSL